MVIIESNIPIRLRFFFALNIAMEFRTRPVKANAPKMPTTTKNNTALVNSISNVNAIGTNITASIDSTLNMKPIIKIAFCLGVLRSFSVDILSSQ